MCRQTFGYHRNKFRGSISYLQKHTGLSRSGVKLAAKRLEKRETITRTRGSGVTQWKINIEDERGHNVTPSLGHEKTLSGSRKNPPSIKERVKKTNNNKRKYTSSKNTKKYAEGEYKEFIEK
jgi:hypothetical protein